MSTPAVPPPRDDGRWILRSRALLEASARDLDGATLSRLARARRAAMDGGVAPAPPSARPLAWLGGLAIVLGLGLMLSRLLPVAPAPGAASDAAAPSAVPAVPPPRIAPTEDTPLAAPDFDLLVDADDEALLDELAFYVWLGAGDDRDGG